MMRVAQALLFLSMMLAACTPRTFTVECSGPGLGLQRGECHDVADAAASQVGQQLDDFGKLMVVSVELVDCQAEGIAQPSSDRCWHVVLDYESGSMSWFAVRDSETGAIRLQQ